MESKVYHIESNFDFLDLGIKGLKSYKVKNQDIVIISFHSSENGNTAPKMGLIEAAVRQAKSKVNNVILFTCFSERVIFSEYVNVSVNILYHNDKVWYHVDKINNVLTIGESRQTVKSLVQIRNVSLPDDF